MGRGSYTVLTTSLLSRHYALTPLPPRPTLQPQVDTYRTRVRGLLSMILQPLLNTRYPRDHLHVATSVPPAINPVLNPHHLKCQLAAYQQRINPLLHQPFALLVIIIITRIITIKIIITSIPVIILWHCTYYRYPIGTYIFTLKLIWLAVQSDFYLTFNHLYIELCD